MEKVIIIGCPGSGKSTFARKLKSVTELPLFHLDMMFWNKDRTNVSKDIFINRLKDTMKNPNWIIDGNYASTMEMRLKECDTVFFLDYSTELCIEGIEKRKGKPRSDMPWIEGCETDDDFISFVKKFNSEKRPEIIELLKKYSSKDVFVFHSREESEEYLKNITEEKKWKV